MASDAGTCYPAGGLYERPHTLDQSFVLVEHLEEKCTTGGRFEIHRAVFVYRNHTVIYFRTKSHRCADRKCLVEYAGALLGRRVMKYELVLPGLLDELQAASHDDFVGLPIY